MTNLPPLEGLEGGKTYKNAKTTFIYNRSAFAAHRLMP